MKTKVTMTIEEFREAQDFEWKHTIHWLHHWGEEMCNLINKNENNKYKTCGLESVSGNLNQFFENDPKVWESFAESIKDKKLLEIGGSCFGVTAMWTFIQDRAMIDPLLEKIAPVLEFMLNPSWYTGTKLYAQQAEQIIPELVGKVDGCIYVRNCLDHTANPWAVLDNIGKYAAPGCQLLLWNHIAHPPDTPGHITITKDPKEIEDYIKKLGFKIIRPVIHGGPAGIIEDDNPHEYGCVAIKI